ncbi:MAG: ATP-binding protein [Pseudohongiellaceae bacterium]
MNWLRANSLQMRLATRLGALFLLATIMLVSMFLYLSYDLADSLSRRDLFELAEELAEEIEDDGKLADVEELIALGWLKEDTHYAIFDNERRVLASSDTAFVEIVTDRAIVSNRTDTFKLDEFGTPPRNYLGLINRERSEAGRVIILVAEPEQIEQDMLNAMVWDVFFKAVWIVPLFTFCTLLVGVLAIRGGLRPLHNTAREAVAINPDAMSTRLNTDNLPSEVFPLVSAVNSALDRLEDGFELQRQFTANAAHELRTPLAIVTGAIEGLGNNESLVKLRQDVARMNRLVEQLLQTARLDSRAVHTHESVDLYKAARHVVEYMAPLAIAQEQSIELSETAVPTHVIGNAHAIEDAIRNLIENAITHAYSTSPIMVTVGAGGSISVSDRGVGIHVENRVRLFDRFCRGDGVAGSGAGLGLSIVQEVMKIHGGSVSVTDNPGGGACFTLHFTAQQ